MNKSETISFSILRVPGHTISAEDQEGMEEIGGRLRLLAHRGPGSGPARPNRAHRLLRFSMSRSSFPSYRAIDKAHLSQWHDQSTRSIKSFLY